MIFKHSYIIILFLFSLGQLGFGQTYNPLLRITNSNADISKDGHVEYNTLNVATTDVKFSLFGDGYFRFRSKFGHQFPNDNKGFTTSTHFLQRYKKKGPIIKTQPTGATGTGTTVNNKISNPAGSSSRVGISWTPCNPIENYFLLIFENTSADTDTGCVELYYDDTQLSLNASGILDYGWAKYKSKKKVTGSSFYNQSLKWEYEDLKPGEQRVIYIPMTSLKGTGTKLYLGSKYSSGCSGNSEISNTSFDSGGFPHDPNTKSANKECLLPFQSDQLTITYTIKFQNEGTAEATDVILKDFLDVSQLDTNTLEFVGSEYPYTYSLVGNLLEITFADIELPGLNQLGPKTYTYDETESFITFKICTYPNLSPGKIDNQAEIIFDTQPAIVTNIAQVPIFHECTEILETCSFANKITNSKAIMTSDVTILPNPVNDLFFIQGLEGKDATINIFNNRGENVKSEFGINKENNSINISDLSKGMYFIQIRNEFLNITKKVIKI